MRELNRVIKAWGFPTQLEPRQFGGSEDVKRPDLAVYTSRTSPIIDVTVVTNTAPSHCEKIDAAAGAAQAKTTKHEENVNSKGNYKFYPIVCETSGHIDSAFDDFVALLTSALPFGSKKQFRREMCFAVSVALQRGNARIMKHAYGRLEDANTFGRRKCF